MSDPAGAAFAGAATAAAGAAAAAPPEPNKSRTTNNDDGAAATTTTATTTSIATVATTTTAAAAAAVDLPDNRFELELEFVQALASPAYIHFLATSRIESNDMTSISLGTETTTTTTGDSSVGSSRSVLQDPAFLEFLKYLRRTWTQPEYARFLTYPDCLFFLNLLIEKHSMMSKEWTLPQFRNFCHQQQFLAWQHRHSVLYGQGTAVTDREKEAEMTGEASGGRGVVPAAEQSEGLATAEPRD